jgi:transposase InsO family protein
MSKPRVIVLSVVQQNLSAAQAAAKFGVSRQWVYQLLARYKADGLDAVEARSHRPRTNPHRTEEAVRARIVQLRADLTTAGLDAGPISIAWRLEAEGLPCPSRATIHRILHAAQVITPQPRKRPRSSYRRFEAAQPNECWQSDFTHWRLADDTDIEILNWLDDHSRMLLSCTAHPRVTGPTVITTFLATINRYGPPASTLTDNGVVYTARFVGGSNGFEYLLRQLNITQKNGHPHHPQTQGKVERFHQTLKRWLTGQPAAGTIAELQHQLDTFTAIYNDHRRHRAHGQTPSSAYASTLKAEPRQATAENPYRVRTDTIDRFGKLTLRHAGHLHHLGVGIHHANTPALILVHPSTVDVINPATGELLSRHDIDPDHNYWRDTQKRPGRWPGPPKL